MTSRERVICTLNRHPVDRFPIDLGSHMSTGISAFAYWNLREHLGLSTENIWMPDMVQGLAYVDRDVLERFHCDCILLEPPFERTSRWNPRGEYRFTVPAEAHPTRTSDGSWVIRKGDAEMRMPLGGFYFDGAWLSDWGMGSEDDRVALYACAAERIFKETDYATNLVGYSHGLGFGGFGGGSLTDALLAHDTPESLHEARRKSLDDYIRRMGKIIDSFGAYVQLVSLADDMGGQSGPLCNPRYVEEFCIPYYRRFCEFVHTNSDIRVFLHNCGSIEPLIPLLIEAGIDVINPVQVSASNMEPSELKRKYGDRIIFWGGGCDTQNVLGAATPQDVARNVRKLARVFRRGGGFVFNQVHNIMGDVPPENVVAMLDTAYEEAYEGLAVSRASGPVLLQ